MEIDPTNLESETLLDMVKPTGKNILEVGCGDGRASFYMAKDASNYLAIDSDKDAILRAHKKFSTNQLPNLKFETLDATNTGLAENSFDIVFMLCAFHEIETNKQEQALLEAHRVLKRGGKLIIADPLEPPSQMQLLCNIVCEDFLHFDHSVSVKHSKSILAKAVSDRKFDELEHKICSINNMFENFGELCSSIESVFPEIDWDVTQRDQIKKEFRKSLGVKNDDQKMILSDELDITLLTKC